MDNLRLRNFREDDFEAFHAMCSDYDVVKMVSSWPYPADAEFSRMRMNSPEAKSGLASVIECDGQFAGNIGGVQGELGYMLPKPFWGRGIATWAVREKVRECFRNNDWEKIEAGAWNDNPASIAVLKKNGFVKTRDNTQHCRARGGDVEGQDFELTRANWAAQQALKLDTERLVIEPFLPEDASNFAVLMNDLDIARMMQTIPHPFTQNMAIKWIKRSAFAGKVGFAAKISLKDGTLIGFLGMGGDPVHTAYAIGRRFWGQGYATEAMQGFVKDMAEVYAIKEITAGAFKDNPASQRVLNKLGFKRDGEIMHKASGRVEDAPLFLYRLQTANLGTS